MVHSLSKQASTRSRTPLWHVPQKEQFSNGQDLHAAAAVTSHDWQCCTQHSHTPFHGVSLTIPLIPNLSHRHIKGHGLQAMQDNSTEPEAESKV